MNILPMETILPLSLPLMSVYIAKIAIIVAWMVWHMDSAAAVKCIGYRLESLLAGHFNKGSVYWRGETGM